MLDGLLRYPKGPDGKPGKVLSTHTGERVELVGEPDANLTELILDLEQWSHIIGVFAGAMATGATRENLEAIKRNLIAE